MSQDLHSLIDQAVERTKLTVASGPDHSARETAQDRLAGWRSELAGFSEEFQRDLTELLDEVTKLTTAARRSAALPTQDMRNASPEIVKPAPPVTAAQSAATSDQEQDRLSALKERLSRQLQTSATSPHAANSPSPAAEKMGGQ